LANKYGRNVNRVLQQVKSKQDHPKFVWQFVEFGKKEVKMYHYKIKKINRVIDGDTVDINIDSLTLSNGKSLFGL
jgi:endonuclease YncB( thermonuclease family)